MSGGSAAAYLARRAAQKERVRILYRRALKETLNWAVHRHLFYRDASELRDKFDANSHVEDLDTIDRMIENGEAEHNKWRHPDPYIVPWAPGGSKFNRNPVPPAGDDGTGRVFVVGARGATGFQLTVGSEVFEESGRSLVRGTRGEFRLVEFRLWPQPQASR